MQPDLPLRHVHVHPVDVGECAQALDDAVAAVRAYLVEQGLPLSQVLLDAGARLGPAIGSKGLPTTLFYDARGRQVDAHFGVLNAAALESRLKAVRPAP